jgi:hypothetical protein
LAAAINRIALLPEVPGMASPLPPISFADLPSDLVRAVAQEAALDAHRVGCFLDEFLGRLGLAPAEGRSPLPLSRDFLLELAAALRLLVWETNGVRCHVEAGLPPAGQALRNAFRWLHPATAPQAGAAPERLMPRVLALFIERLAWNGRVELGADVVLGEADEDLLADVITDFLWCHRHDLGNEGHTARGTP